MSLTKAQLRTRALQQLGVLAASEEASSADAQIVDSGIDEAFADLDDVVPFASSATPDWAVNSMVHFVAARVGPLFGVANAVPEDAARGMLITAIDRRNGIGKQPKVDYF